MVEKVRHAVLTHTHMARAPVAGLPAVQVGLLPQDGKALEPDVAAAVQGRRAEALRALHVRTADETQRRRGRGARRRRRRLQVRSRPWTCPRPCWCLEGLTPPPPPRRRRRPPDGNWSPADLDRYIADHIKPLEEGVRRLAQSPPAAGRSRPRDSGSPQAWSGAAASSAHKRSKRAAVHGQPMQPLPPNAAAEPHAAG